VLACFNNIIQNHHAEVRVLGAVLLEPAIGLFGWGETIVYDRKFPAGTIFFSHINQPAVLLHEPATIRTSQPNKLYVIIL